MERQSLVFEAQSQKLSEYQKQLGELSDQLDSYPSPFDYHIRKYIAIYMEARGKSEEFFPILCEHNIFERTLSKNVTNLIHLEQCTCLLECVNLLMSNTKTTNQIVYYLSQTSLHEYLFNSNILKENHEFIQYYIQLVKTILIKLAESPQNKSFIKLFCNERYPSFPIFQICLILATNKENELVKVTAQQCVLILIGLINQYTIFQPYLSEIGLFVMVAKLIIHAEQLTLDTKSETPHNYDEFEEISKYLVDLIYELRQNRTPLLMLNNLICNLIIFRNMPKNWTHAFKFIVSLCSSLCLKIEEQYNNLEHPIVDNLLIICAVHLRVITKLTTNFYLTGCMISTHFNVNSQPLSDLSSEMFPSQYSQYKTITQILGSCQINFIPEVQTDNMNSPGRKTKMMVKQRSRSESQLQTDFLSKIIQIVDDFERSKEFYKMKSVCDKKVEIGKIGRQTTKNDGIFGFLFKKTDWIKKIASLVGVQMTKGKLIYKIFPKCLNPSTSVFISEYAHMNRHIDLGTKINEWKFGQHASTCEYSEIYINFISEHVKFDKHSLALLNILAEQYQIFQGESLEGLTFQSSYFMEQHTVISKLYVPYYTFLVLQFREYLSSRLHELVVPSPKNRQLICDVESIVLLYKLCEKLGVKINKKRYRNKTKITEVDFCFKKLIEEMKIINEYVQTCIYQGDINDIGSKFWRVRESLLNRNIFEEKIHPKSYISQIKPQKARGKKKMSHRDRIKSKIDMTSSMSYLKQKKEKVISKMSQNSKMKKEEESKKEQEDMEQFFTRKMLIYQCLQKIISPKLKSLDEFYEQQWSISTLPTEVEQQDDFSSVISSDNSLITVQEVIKEFSISYFGKNQCKLIFLKVYFPPKIMLIISLHNKNFVEIQIKNILEIKENKIDRKVLQIITINDLNAHNIEAIRMNDDEQAKKLVNKFRQCKDMENAAFASAIFGYLSDTYANIVNDNSPEQKKEKREKKIQIYEPKNHSMVSGSQKRNPYQQTNHSLQETPGRF